MCSNLHVGEKTDLGYPELPLEGMPITARNSPPPFSSLFQKERSTFLTARSGSDTQFIKANKLVLFAAISPDGFFFTFYFRLAFIVSPSQTAFFFFSQIGKIKH